MSAKSATCREDERGKGELSEIGSQERATLSELPTQRKIGGAMDRR